MRFLLLPTTFLLVCCFLGCRKGPGLPDPSSAVYQEVVADFYSGIAGIQAGNNRIAEEKLVDVTKLAPDEPAAWVNLGVLALREYRNEEAPRLFERARSLAPNNSQILLLSAIAENRLGRSNNSLAFLREAIGADPANLKAINALVEQLEQDNNENEVTRLIETMVEQQPDNLAILLLWARNAAGHENMNTLQIVVNRIVDSSISWPPDVQEQINLLEAAVADNDPALCERQVFILNNVLKRMPAFLEDLAAIQTPAEVEGDLMPHFLRLPIPNSRPAPADTTLHFGSEHMNIAGGPWTWMSTFALAEMGPENVVVADGRVVQLESGDVFPFPGGPNAEPPHSNGIVGIDYNYDFLLDLAVVGAGGFRLFRQNSSGAFTEATSQTMLPPSLTENGYTGIWAADLDLEGDVDLILAPPNAPPVILLNNGDGKFSQHSLFENVRNMGAFFWADLDADGDPDASLLDTNGNLYVYANQRGGLFDPWRLPEISYTIRAMNVADLNGDAVIDLVVLREDGTVSVFAAEQQTDSWNTTDIIRWPDIPTLQSLEAYRLFIQDVDNNGSLDLIVSTPSRSRVWQSTGQDIFIPHHSEIEIQVSAVADLLWEGRLDLIGLSTTGQPVRMANQSAINYQSSSIRPRAAQSLGDRRINSFGIGGEIEIRSGLLYQKRIIDRPVIYFGLGDALTADVVRIMWPNGDVQAEFDVLSDQTIMARQRLKGSCPWLFAHDGRSMSFVTDFIWRSPLGLAINAQDAAGIMTTEDWVKIRGDQLVPRDGFYDIRITAELWETHFFDHVSLMVVDHPEDTEIFVDERFSSPPPELAVYTMSSTHPFAQVVDDQDRDVTDIVQSVDGRYLGGFSPGRYQGVAQDHYAEIVLGDDVPAEGPTWLIASGWIRPTDSSINVAISQGSQGPPVGVRVEVPDGAGGWEVAIPDMGFPSGKTKTILINIEGIFSQSEPRRLRLRTEMEIYWDALRWATKKPGTTIQTQRLQAELADLRFRGFSEVFEADRLSPELPVYGRLIGTSQIWRDLIGYYTRFGDVRELLDNIDDRYVIMNAGDELVLRFPAVSDPPDGWTRDYVLVGDGWVKDGDYNTTYSKTVLPLPSHDQSTYTTPPGRLEDDPIYQRHNMDWQTYHTRYITTTRFHFAMSER